MLIAHQMGRADVPSGGGAHWRCSYRHVVSKEESKCLESVTLTLILRAKHAEKRLAEVVLCEQQKLFLTAPKTIIVRDK